MDSKFSMKNSFKFWHQQKFFNENLNSKSKDLVNKKIQKKLLRLNN